MAQPSKEAKKATSNAAHAPGRTRRPPSPIVDLPSGNAVNVPPPSVKIRTVIPEATGSIRIVLEAEVGNSERKIAIPGTTLSATVVDTNGVPFGGLADTDALKAMVDGLDSAEHRADVEIELVSPDDQSGVDLSVFKSIHVVGDFVCIDSNGTYVGTDQAELNVGDDGEVRMTIHSVR